MRQVSERLAEIRGLLFETLKGQANIMAGQQELEQEIQSLQQTASDTATRVQTVIDGLKNHPAAPDLAPQIAELETIRTGLAGIAPADSGGTTDTSGGTTPTT